ncbi:TonB-dependent receptor [Flavobacteriaceae bacterium AU392]|nr:TonB-dependent receptor [Flavobacteriaceae bacterium]RKM84964.1 TonB-dependent receptor [Flavobacteriaceae bacterium AU392]
MKLINYTKTTVVIIALLAFKTIIAQQTGSIKGTVTLDNKPVLGANIYLKSNTSIGVTTNFDGTYALETLPVGEQTIAFAYIGADVIYKKIIIKTGEIIALDTNLISNISLQEVVVSVPGSKLQKDLVVNVEKQQLADINSSTSNTLAESITNLNGVSQNSTGNSIGKPVIRGLTSNRVVTYAQGTRIENQQWGGEHGLGVSSTGVKSVEVIKGPASLLYGSDAIGGVLYFVEEDFTEKPVEGIVETGFFSNTSTSQNRAGVKTKTGGFRFNFYGGFTSAGDYTLPDDVQLDGDRVFNTRFDEKSIKASIGLKKEKITSKLTYSFLNNFFGIPDNPENTPFTNDNSRSFLLPFQDVTQHNLALENSFKLGKAKVNVILGYAENDRQEFNEVDTEPDLHLNLDVYSYNVRVSDLLKTSSKFDLTFGAQGLFQNNENRGTVFLIPDGTSNENGVFGLFNFKATENLKFQSGLRFDSKTITAESVEIDGVTNFADFDETYNTLNYSLGAKYDVNDFSFRFNIASGFRAPNVSELLSNGEHGGIGRIEVGDQNLTSESATQFDFAINYQNNGLKIIVNPFLNIINDYIFITPTGERGERNLPIFAYLQDDATLYGGEFNLNYQPYQLSKLSFQTGIALTFGEDSNNNPLPLIPPVNFNSRLSYDFNIGKSLKLNSGYIQVLNSLEQNRVTQEELPNDAYTLVNLGFSATYNSFQFNFTVKNLFDTVYTDHLSLLKTFIDGFVIPNPGRDIVMNLKYNF